METWSRAVNKAYDTASNLGNLLPTGTYLAYTTIAPIVTDNGSCDQGSEIWLTIGTTVCFSIFCLVSSFTDSFQASDGQVYYGLVTMAGLWTPQLPSALKPADGEQYKLKFIDFVHAFLALLVFLACSMLTPNIRSCLYSRVRDDFVRTVPALVSLVASWIFTKFPSSRHGVGFPVTPASLFRNEGPSVKSE